MKNVILFLAFIIIPLPFTSIAQNSPICTSEFTVRYGDYSDEAFVIYVFATVNENNYTEAEFVLGCRAAQELLPATIHLYGSEKLMRFCSELRAMRNKYSEWLKVAQENNIRDLVKEIPIKTSAVKLKYYDGQMNVLKSVDISLKGVFMAEFNSFSLFPDINSIYIMGNNVSFEDIPIFHIRTVNDFDKIIQALDYRAIKGKIDAIHQNDNLFN